MHRNSNILSIGKRDSGVFERQFFSKKRKKLALYSYDNMLRTINRRKTKKAIAISLGASLKFVFPYLPDLIWNPIKRWEMHAHAKMHSEYRLLFRWPSPLSHFMREFLIPFYIFLLGKLRRVGENKRYHSSHYADKKTIHFFRINYQHSSQTEN